LLIIRIIGNMEIYFWFILTYIVGTLLGYHFAWNRACDKVAGATLDILEANGYIKTKKVGNEIELIKVK